MVDTVTISLKYYNELKMKEKSFDEKKIIYVTEWGSMVLMEESEAISKLKSMIDAYKRSEDEIKIKKKKWCWKF